MAKPNPQFNTPLSPNQINAELPFYPLYGVTPDNKYTPVAIDENGQLSIGAVTITGPVTVSDVVIKGVDPDNSFVTEDISVYNLGPSNGYAMRSTLFDGGNHLAINPDGSINVDFSGLSTVTAKIEDTAGNPLTSTSGSLNVDVTNIVPVSQSGTWNINNISGTVSLPTGAATETTLAGIKTDTDKFTFLSTRLLVDGSQVTQPISGTVAATQSGSWSVSLTSGSIEIGTVDQGTPNTAANAWPVKPTDGTNSQSFTASGEAKVTVTQPLPSGTNTIGSINVSGTSTSSLTSIAASVTGVVLLAANPNRKMTTIFNDSTSNMYLALGSSVSTTNFTTLIKSMGYYEFPLPVYLGSVNAIWDVAVGSARITEFS